MTQTEILVPLLNANEPEARVVAIHVSEAQAVEKGSLLFTIETTKATVDVESPAGGFVRLLAKEGDLLGVGARLAVITATAEEPLVHVEAAVAASSAPNGLRITQPARALAESLGLDLDRLPTDRLVTESVVRALAGELKVEFDLPRTDLPPILVYGAGGHAKSVMEIILQAKQYGLVGIVDDNLALAGRTILGVHVLGGKALLPELVKRGVTLAANGVGGILDIGVRVRVFAALEQAGFQFPTLVHPSATLETSAVIGDGVQVFARAYIGAEAVLKERCMVNTAAVISHDCVIGEYSHIAPGALLAGHVHVGERTLVGMGVTTAVGVQIGAGVRIGNSAIILADVPDRTIIQAGRYWTGLEHASRQAGRA